MQFMIDWKCETGGMEYSQEPINCDDKADVISGEAHRGQHDDHGDQSSLGDSSSTDTGSCGCDAVQINKETFLAWEYEMHSTRCVIQW